MEVEAVIKEISKLATLAEKLTFYNQHYCSLSQIDIRYHQVGFANCSESKNIFCLCSNCKDKYSLNDFEMYRNLRNTETDRIIYFFNDSDVDYSDKVEYYFKISIGFSKTSRKLYFVPEDINSIYDNEFQYRLSIIDITPRNENEQNILKACIKRELINHTSRITISLNQFTLENRIAVAEAYLKIRKDKTRREEFIHSEYDKITLSKIDKNSKRPYDVFNYQILQIVENLIQNKHVEDYTEFSHLKRTILAEDCIKYEQYLNNLSLPESERELTLTNQERNVLTLSKYYNCIGNVRVFKDEILNSSRELHYNKRTKLFIENRNNAMLKNILLKEKAGWLKPFNSNLKNFMNQIVICFKYVLEWKDTNIKFHESAINVRLSNQSQFFLQLPESLRLNYDNNNDLLVLKMREYYLNGFNSMLDFLKSELLIDFESSPYFPRFAKIIDDIKNAVDIESLKLGIEYQLKDKDSQINKPLPPITNANGNINLRNQLSNNNVEADKELAKTKKLHNLTWFKVGLLFANGAAQKLYLKYKADKGHFKKITLELGFKDTDRPHFSETFNNSTDHPKNIYRNLEQLEKIHNYCADNNILIDADFLSNFNALKDK